METVDKKSKIANRIFYIILALLIVGSVGVTFYKIVILKDYQIVAETSCNPTTEKCFVYTDEESGEVSYYKLISKKAMNISLCEATEEKLGCEEELACTENELSCSYTYCDATKLSDGEACAK
jgi:hypothetical protein